jgi:hypothetical protein
VSLVADLRGPRRPLWATIPVAGSGLAAAYTQRQFRARGAETAMVSLALLTRTGLAAPDAVGAVLLYRIITFKIVVTFGWIGYRYLQERTQRAVT